MEQHLEQQVTSGVTSGPFKLKVRVCGCSVSMQMYYSPLWEQDSPQLTPQSNQKKPREEFNPYLLVPTTLQLWHADPSSK